MACQSPCNECSCHLPSLTFVSVLRHHGNNLSRAEVFFACLVALLCYHAAQRCQILCFPPWGHCCHFVTAVIRLVGGQRTASSQAAWERNAEVFWQYILDWYAVGCSRKCSCVLGILLLTYPVPPPVPLRGIWTAELVQMNNLIQGVTSSFGWLMDLALWWRSLYFFITSPL